MLTLLRRVLRLSMLGCIGIGVWKAVQARRGGDSWQSDPWISTGPAGATVPSPSPASVKAAPAPEAPTSESRPADPTAGPAVPSRPAKPTNRPAGKAPSGRAEDPPGERLWVKASEGVCPETHPVKAKLASRIFHTPGSRNYSRTKADRCYPDEAAAQGDGLRPPQR